MPSGRSAVTRMQRARVFAVSCVLALSSLAWAALPVAAQDADGTAIASPSAAEAACSSADDLRLIIGFTRDSLEAEAGLIPVAVGVIAALSEARELAGLVGETYRPLVDDLVLSLQDMRDTLGALGDEETAGAKLVAIGDSLSAIGAAMDELGTQLRDPCPSGA